MLFSVEFHKKNNGVAINFDKQTGRMLVAILNDIMRGEVKDHEHLLSSDGLEQLTISRAPDSITVGVLTLNFLPDDDARVTERHTRYPLYGGNLFYEANGIPFEPSKDSDE